MITIRFPKPVLIKPRENKKAPTINQIAELAKPDIASPIFKVPVKAATVITTMDTPPIGNGWVIKPTIVATKMANKCQD